MNPDDVAKSRHEKGSQTKIRRTRERILTALEELIEEDRASAITITEICARAGMSTDPFYGGRHEALRVEVDRRIRERAAPVERPGRRSLRLPVSKTAQAAIEELRLELKEAQARYASALQAVNVLSQVVRALSKGTPSSDQVIALVQSKRVD